MTPAKSPSLKAPEHLRIGCRRDEDVAVGQQKRRVADEFLCQFRRLAGAVLDDLPAERDARTPFRAVAKMIFDDLGAKAGDDENVADARRDDAVRRCVRGWVCPATRSMGLGSSLVSSRMRVPLPAARMTAFTGGI